MIEPATGWLEIVQYNYKHAATIANLVEQLWLCRYPRPTIITYNFRNEFLGHEFKNDIIKNEYVLRPSLKLRKIHKQDLHWNEFTHSYQTSCLCLI